MARLAIVAALAAALLVSSALAAEVDPKVWSGVSGIGIGKARTLALAREQQRQIAASLR